jgi:hypothetical protein
MGTIRANYHFESRQGFERRSRYTRRLKGGLVRESGQELLSIL